MTRTRAEAEQLASKRHGDVGPDKLQVLTTLYLRTFDWACSNCGKTGTLVKINGGIRTSDCICKVLKKKKEAVEKLRQVSNIPQKYLEADIKKWSNTGKEGLEKENNDKSYFVVKSYVAHLAKMIQKGYGLYIAGKNGVGKTYLACAIANHALCLLKSVRYYTMASIIKTEIKGWRDEEAADVMSGIKKSDLLVIDDIDKVYRTATDIEGAVFDNILRERLQNSKPCIFTSNKTIVQAKEAFGENVASMLVEHCTEIVFLGHDFRRSISNAILKEITDGS